MLPSSSSHWLSYDYIFILLLFTPSPASLLLGTFLNRSWTSCVRALARMSFRCSSTHLLTWQPSAQLPCPRLPPPSPPPIITIIKSLRSFNWQLILRSSSLALISSRSCAPNQSCCETIVDMYGAHVHCTALHSRCVSDPLSSPSSTEPHAMHGALIIAE